MAELEKLINFRVPSETHAKMKEIAKREERPISYLTRKAVVSFVEGYPESKRILEPRGE